jgi:hypothetical protein
MRGVNNCSSDREKARTQAARAMPCLGEDGILLGPKLGFKQHTGKVYNIFALITSYQGAWSTPKNPIVDMIKIVLFTAKHCTQKGAEQIKFPSTSEVEVLDSKSPRAKFQMDSSTVSSSTTSASMSHSKKAAVLSGEGSEGISYLITARMVADDPLRPGEQNEPTKSRNGEELVERELRQESRAASAIRK